MTTDRPDMQRFQTPDIGNMKPDIGPYTAADELLHHQITDTFGTIAQSDLAWTEKLWTPVSKKDGSLQLDMGMGRYHNRDIIDGFAGLSRGREQWTVRASRELRSDPFNTQVAPIRYEVVEPLNKIRWTLDDNDVIPLRFDITFEAAHPGFFEDRHKQRDELGFRVVSDVVRWHQAGVPRGWYEIEGRREEIDPDEWYCFRDHSWGVRMDVGTPPPDLRPRRDFGDTAFADAKFHLTWSPMLLQRPDGSRYGYQYYLLIRGDEEEVTYFSGYRNNADGSQDRIAYAWRDLKYDAHRRLLGGQVHFQMLSGAIRTVEIEVMGESGFYLGTALYLGFDGRKHGQWHGEHAIEGEMIPDITADEWRSKMNSDVRDTIIKVREGDAVGYGLVEPIVNGDWPEMIRGGGQV